MSELISNVSYRTRHPRSRLNRSAVTNLKSTFWITFWASWIVFAPLYWIAFAKDGGIILVGFNLFFQALMVVLAVVFEPFPRRINSALDKFIMVISCLSLALASPISLAMHIVKLS